MQRSVRSSHPEAKERRLAVDSASNMLTAKNSGDRERGYGGGVAVHVLRGLGEIAVAAAANIGDVPVSPCPRFPLSV
jgi:hypothetical protein